MAQLDDDIGLVMKKLKDMGEDDNTIVVFTTDNGTEVFTWPDGGRRRSRSPRERSWKAASACLRSFAGPAMCRRTRCRTASSPAWTGCPPSSAAAGNPNITEELLKGKKIGDRTYKNHLDGYNQMAAITGKGPSARHEIFYLGESTVGAVRIDDYKFRFIDQPHGWLGEKTHVDVPYITNLRLDPFERTGWPNNGTKEGAQQYFDWFKYPILALRVRPAGDGQGTPDLPRLPADAAGRELQPRRGQSGDGEKDGRGGDGEQRPRPVTGMTFTAGGSQGPPARSSFRTLRIFRQKQE